MLSYVTKIVVFTINILPIHLFLNEWISMCLDKHLHMSLDIKGYFVIQMSHFSKGMMTVASILGQ